MNMNNIPKTCGECIYYSEKYYTCHNEKGIESHCAKKQFADQDTRDKSYKNKNNKFCEIYYPNKIKRIK